MGTRHQYLLLSAPPEKENIFRELKEKHGSTYAFHGSSVENWHSILRKGLVNASGTRLQVNGAAYGSGIYLSPSVCFILIILFSVESRVRRPHRLAIRAWSEAADRTRAIVSSTQTH